MFLSVETAHVWLVSFPSTVPSGVWLIWPLPAPPPRVALKTLVSKFWLAAAAAAAAVCHYKPFKPQSCSDTTNQKSCCLPPTSVWKIWATLYSSRLWCQCLFVCFFVDNFKSNHPNIFFLLSPCSYAAQRNIFATGSTLRKYSPVPGRTGTSVTSGGSQRQLALTTSRRGKYCAGAYFQSLRYSCYSLLLFIRLYFWYLWKLCAFVLSLGSCWIYTHSYS